MWCGSTRRRCSLEHLQGRVDRLQWEKGRQRASLSSLNRSTRRQGNVISWEKADPPGDTGGRSVFTQLLHKLLEQIHLWTVLDSKGTPGFCWYKEPDRLSWRHKPTSTLLTRLLGATWSATDSDPELTWRGWGKGLPTLSRKPLSLSLKREKINLTTTKQWQQQRTKGMWDKWSPQFKQQIFVLAER